MNAVRTLPAKRAGSAMVGRGLAKAGTRQPYDEDRS